MDNILLSKKHSEIGFTPKFVQNIKIKDNREVTKRNITDLVYKVSHPVNRKIHIDLEGRRERVFDFGSLAENFSYNEEMPTNPKEAVLKSLEREIELKYDKIVLLYIKMKWREYLLGRIKMESNQLREDMTDYFRMTESEPNIDRIGHVMNKRPKCTLKKKKENRTLKQL